jgi:hypothetical protein
VDCAGQPVTGRPFRLAAIVASFALLGACNVVMTKEPLFTQADGAGAPNLRPGVWIFFKQPDCKLDESRPFTDWPDCAGGGLVTPGDVKGHKANAPKDELEDTPFVLAPGDPRILQVQVDVDLSVQADASASGDATVSTSSSAAHSRPYGYGAVRPTKFDDQGRITAFTLWPIQCGPPPPKDKDGNDVAAATLKPLPGLEMKPGDAVCTTSSLAALRNAAKASEAWAPQPRSDSHWIRDAQR